MRRAIALYAASGIALSALALVPAQATPYYLIRYDNTGFCQIWDQGYQSSLGAGHHRTRQSVSLSRR